MQIEATYFVGRLLEAVHLLLPMVAASLKARLETDHAFRGEMAVWAVRQGIAGDPRDADFAESIARQIIYRLLGKVLFFQSLRRSARHLPDLDLRDVDTARVLPTLPRLLPAPWKSTTTRSLPRTCRIGSNGRPTPRASLLR